jgi:hypothetical protein
MSQLIFPTLIKKMYDYYKQIPTKKKGNNRISRLERQFIDPF